MLEDSKHSRADEAKHIFFLIDATTDLKLGKYT